MRLGGKKIKGLSPEKVIKEISGQKTSKEKEKFVQEAVEIAKKINK